MTSGVMRTSVRSRRCLADDFVPGGEGNQVGEAFERDDIAVVHQLPDGVSEMKNFCSQNPIIVPYAPAVVRIWPCS